MRGGFDCRRGGENHSPRHAPRVPSEGLLGHNVVEVLSGNVLAVGGGSLEHVLELLDAHGLSELLRDSLQVVEVDQTASVVIEEIENLIDS